MGSKNSFWGTRIPRPCLTLPEGIRTFLEIRRQNTLNIFIFCVGERGEGLDDIRELRLDQARGGMVAGIEIKKLILENLYY